MAEQLLARYVRVCGIMRQSRGLSLELREKLKKKVKLYTG